MNRVCERCGHSSEADPFTTLECPTYNGMTGDYCPLGLDGEWTPLTPNGPRTYPKDAPR